MNTFQPPSASSNQEASDDGLTLVAVQEGLPVDLAAMSRATQNGSLLIDELRPGYVEWKGGAR